MTSSTPAPAAPSLASKLPPEMGALQSRPLFAIMIEVLPPQAIFEAPIGLRRVTIISGGRFEGEKLRGEIMPIGGSDWQTVRSGDGTWLLNVRLVLKTDDGEHIMMAYEGMRHGPKEVLDAIGRGESVSPYDYYLRISARFETTSKKYDFLNRLIAVGVGHRLPEGAVYQMFEIV